MGNTIDIRTTGTLETKREFQQLAVKALSPAQIRKIFRAVAQPLLRKAKANAKRLANNTAKSSSVKSKYANKGGRYKLAKEYANSIAIKKIQYKRQTHIVIGPLQSKLNTGKTVQWKGRKVPIAHWKEFGTTVNRKGAKGGRIRGGFAVWKATKDLKKSMLVQIETLVDKRLGDYINNYTSYLRFQKA